MVTDSKHTADEVLVVNLTELPKPANVDFTLLTKTVSDILQHFNELSDPKVIQEIKSVEYKLLVEDIIQQQKAFIELVEDCTHVVNIMSTYMKANNEYIEIMMQEPVSGEEFLDAITSLLELATAHKKLVEKENKAFCQLQFNLQTILSNLGDYNVDLSGDQRLMGHLLEQDASKFRKTEKENKWAAVGTGIGAGIALAATPFTAGASLAVVGALAVGSGGAMIGTTIQTIINGGRAKGTEKELELLRLEEVKMHAIAIAEDLKTILVELTPLDTFWQTEIDGCNGILEKYQDIANTSTFKVTKMKGMTTIRQWDSVKATFESFQRKLEQCIN